MSGTDGAPARVEEVASPMPNRRIRNSALLLTSLALAFYVGFIALTFYRSHH
jgi:hypothetical protein